MGACSAPPAVFRGPTCKGAGGRDGRKGVGESSSFASPRKKKRKVGAYVQDLEVACLTETIIWSSKCLERQRSITALKHYTVQSYFVPWKKTQWVKRTVNACGPDDKATPSWQYCLQAWTTVSQSISRCPVKTTLMHTLPASATPTWLSRFPRKFA